MFDRLLIKYAEIGVKGKNRYIFEDKLVSNIHSALSKLEGKYKIRKVEGRIYVECISDYDFEDTIEALKKVFGIAGICPLLQIEDNGFDDLAENVKKFVDTTYEDKNKTFKVVSRRARKNYPLDSMELNSALGGVILAAFPEMKVDVHNPDIEIYVEIREKINIYSHVIPGLGGMPVGTAGAAMLLLSGGIDSPVAGYMVSKRGVKLNAIYFNAPPYTSERAKQKVIDLAGAVSKYSGSIKLHIVNFTDCQLKIYENCPHDQLTIIMRRYMMKIAERFAEKEGCLGLVTGESIGQVASQTMQSMAVTNEVCNLPVYRPLIAFDKQDIVDIALKIDTYETSILPYEDCCTIFVAKHPVTKPTLKGILKSEARIEEEMESLVETAIETTEIIKIR